MESNRRGGRRMWAVLVTAALVFSSSVIAQGWLIFRAHGGMLDFAYLNKRLDEHVIITVPVVTTYFLIAYGAFRRGWRRLGGPIDLGAVCARGAVAAVLPGAVMLLLGSPVLAVLALSLGVTAFGWMRVILTGGQAADLRMGLRRGLVVAATVSVCAGLVFTLWLVWGILWRDMDVDYFAARQGMVAYAPIAAVAVLWLVASSGAVLGAGSLGLFLIAMLSRPMTSPADAVGLSRD